MHDARLGTQCGGVAGPDDLPLLDDEAAIGQVEQRPKVLVDDDQRQPLGLELGMRRATVPARRSQLRSR